MWSNQTSIQRAVGQQLRFRPPYCPNPRCRMHPLENGKQGHYVRYGTRPISQFPYITQRFRCSACRKVFSSSVFSLKYRNHTPDNYEEILDLYHGGFSRRETARFLKCSVDTVLRRFSRMAEQGLLKQAYYTRNSTINESIAYDGIENFSFSQYDPNNINHAVGRETFFTYDFNFAPLNRKGRMSPRQKKRKAELEFEHGPYPRNAIRSSTERIFRRLLVRTPQGLQLHTDKHYVYREVIARLRERDRICHLITPAKAARNYRNRLFAVNHLELLTRHNSAAFRRETIAFSKHSIAMIESFVLLMVRKNFMRPIFYKKHVQDPTAHLESPAMRLRLTSRILSFHEFFGQRIQRTQVALNEDWALFVSRKDPFSRRPIAAYQTG